MVEAGPAMQLATLLWLPKVGTASIDALTYMMLTWQLPPLADLAVGREVDAWVISLPCVLSSP